MTIRRLSVVGSVTLYRWALKCERCDHAWKTVAAEAPTRCPKCKARGFDKPARAYNRKTKR